jgi:uncharacterized protein (TIGR02271 family)
MDKRSVLYIYYQGGACTLAKERSSSDRFPEVEERYSDYELYDKNYQKIGKVDDLFVDDNDQPEYIGVKMGFLGTTSALIPVELVRVNDKRKLLEVAADKETVKGGPTFGDDREITAEFERRVRSYYQVQTAQSSSAGPERGAYEAYYSDAARDERAGSRQRSGERHASSTAARSSGVDRAHDSDLRDEEELRIRRVEEELRAGTREREVGRLRVRKRVRIDRERVRVPKRREEVNVERVPVNREASEAEIGEEEEFFVPVSEEEVVVEKRPVVKEEIRLRKDVVEEEEVVERDVRKEEVDIDDQTRRRDR